MDIDVAAERLIRSKRILVLGSSGSGKTTLSLRLASLLRVKAIHLDSLFWRTGWSPTPRSEWLEIVESIVHEDEWIMDGTYESSLSRRIPAAEAAIVLYRSRWACLRNVVRRKLATDDARRPDAPPGQPVDMAFVKYVWNYPRVTQPLVDDLLARYGPHLTTVRLYGAGDVRRLVAAVARSQSGLPDSDVRPADSRVLRNHH